jgi:diguanylate cyclase (GGDEF)-like protein/PAS domain S-box-containing protein
VDIVWGVVTMKEDDAYRLLVEHMPALVCRFGPDGTVSYVNQTYCTYFQMSRGELIARDFLRFVPPEEREEVRRRLDSLTPSNPEATYEHPIVEPGGQVRWQRWTSWGIFSDGQLVEYHAIGHDITAEKHAERELRRLSYQDSLTGIANRRLFEEILEQSWRMEARNRNPMSLIVGDIDFFKAYNDAYGHRQGDECLRRGASAFAGCLRRAGDLAAREGGEEFAALLPGTGLSGATLVAETIRRAVSGLGIPSASSPEYRYVTISLGVAETVPTANASPWDLVEWADQALYRAKWNGRNRVHAASVARTGGA